MNLNNQTVVRAFVIFVLGFCIGSFFSLVVIREAFPLKDHFTTLTLYVISVIPIVLILFVWYQRTIHLAHRHFGQETGKIIGYIISFLIVSLLIVFIVVTGVFFFAVV